MYLPREPHAQYPCTEMYLALHLSSYFSLLTSYFLHELVYLHLFKTSHFLLPTSYFLHELVYLRLFKSRQLESRSLARNGGVLRTDLTFGLWSCGKDDKKRWNLRESARGVRGETRRGG